jgi:raffinose/stachyose/melibiose transport system substrate-binding protein
MKSRRVFLSTCVAVAASSVLIAACGNAGGAAAGSGGSVSLRVGTLSGYTDFETPQTPFSKAHPGVSFQDSQSPSNTYQAVTAAQLNAGTAPDIIDVWGGAGNAMAVGQLVPKNELLDLSSQSWASKEPTIVKDDLTVDGKLYAQASYVLPTGIVYNTSLEKSLGVTVPTTFSQLLSFCRTVSAKGVTPIELGNQTGSENELIPGQIADDLIYSTDSSWPSQVQAGTQSFSGNSLWEKSLTTGVTEYMEMNAAKCFESDSTGVSANEAYQAVATNKALGIDIFTNAIPGITADAPSIQLGTFSLPANNNPADTWVTGDLGFAASINAKSKNVKTAEEYLDYLATPAVSSAAAKANYGLSTTPGVKVAATGVLGGFSSSYQAGQFALFPSNYYPNYNVKLTIIAQMESLIAGSTTIPKAMSAIEASYEGK